MSAIFTVRETRGFLGLNLIAGNEAARELLAAIDASEARVLRVEVRLVPETFAERRLVSIEGSGVLVAYRTAVDTGEVTP
jgi:hypothetical protein